MTIFVSIAAYRDRDLIPTIEDCIARARWPGELRFGVCWQHDADEVRPPRLAGKRMRLIDVPWRESQGACWARAELMKLYDGEDYFLQLDSHHRFEQDWDALLLADLEASSAARPLLTTYGTPFDPALAPPPGQPTDILFCNFRPDGTPSVMCRLRPDLAGQRRPARARFLSAHLLFAPGRFITDVPYDPELYFHGEEITLAIRAFTHGYDLFHPSRHILWHQEPRRVTPLHWDDHVAEQGFRRTAAERDAASLAKVGRFLREQPVGALACGPDRSFGEYEAYAGLRFLRRQADAAARRGIEPAPAAPPRAALRTWRVRIGLDRAQLSPAALQDARFWYVGMHDENDVEIARADADHGEVRRSIAAANGEIVIERECVSVRPPARWTIWPVDRHGRWLERLSGPVAGLPA